MRLYSLLLYDGLDDLMYMMVTMLAADGGQGGMSVLGLGGCRLVLEARGFHLELLFQGICVAVVYIFFMSAEVHRKETLNSERGERATAGRRAL